MVAGRWGVAERPRARRNSTTLPQQACSACDKFSLMAEADHRIADNLAMLNSYLRLKVGDLTRRSSELDQDAARLVLEGACAQLETVERLHRSLCRGARDADPDLIEHLRGVCASFGAVASDRMELIQEFTPGCRVRLDQIMPLSQIVTEVITNAFKHGLSTGEPGVVIARCRKDVSGMVLVEVVDDGDGLPADFDPSVDGGLGFRLVRALARQLGARLQFRSSSSGLCFRLALPTAIA